MRDIWDRPEWDLLTRFDLLEQRVRDLEVAVQGVTIATFSIVGTVSPFIPTHRYYVEHGYNIMQARMSVGTTPSGSGCSGSIYINGVLLSSLSISSGGYSDVDDINRSVSISGGDYLTVQVDTVSGSEADWTFQVRMIRTE